ncbi:MAG: DUF2786 domain-containing protein [Actinomycetota bacterium]|nr:DUF2786 domain-containing protein [Actinomycetota bacterium]
MRSLLWAAAVAYRQEDEPAYRELIAYLDHGRPGRDDGRLVASSLGACLAEEVRRAWVHGWQPADVVRVAARELGSGHARYVTDVIAADALRYAGSVVDPRWTDQLVDLGAGVWWGSRTTHHEQWRARAGMAVGDALAVGVEVLALLGHLPELPLLCVPPGEPGHVSRSRRRPDGHGGRMLVRVRALLAKAESTTFADEAEALTAKAQELMARHAIDEAMVDGGATGGDGPVGVRLAVDDPYASAKSLLLSEVASANSCRAVWSKVFGFSTVFGFDNEVEFVEVLYTSLLVQATAAMNAAGSQVDRYGRSRTRSFRQSFLVAYASRIGDRLRAAGAAGRASATVEYGDALLPVLADRSSAVDDVVGSAFPKMQTRSFGMSNHAGWAAGSAAADLASLSVRPEVRAGGA